MIDLLEGKIFCRQLLASCRPLSFHVQNVHLSGASRIPGPFSWDLLYGRRLRGLFVQV